MTTLRVAVHVHSEWSYDATWSLPRIAAAFRRRRYDVVLLCEHDRGMTQDRLDDYRLACAEASQGILLVPGVEYSDADNVVHLPTWGPVSFLGEGVPTAELLAQVRARGGTSVWAHPSRHDAWDRFAEDWYGLVSGIEVWSRKYDGWSPNRRALAAARRTGLQPLVSLDFHRRRQFAPFATVVDVPGTSVDTGAAVLDAIRGCRGRPEVLGRPLDDFLSGAAARTVHVADLVRRQAARVVRRISP